MNTKEVGERLVEYCRKGMNLDAISSLYSKDIVSVEAAPMGGMPAEVRGLDQVVEKNRRWLDTNDIHSVVAEGPFPNNDRFAVIFRYESTPNDGPMKGKRMKLEEVALYTVKNGKITREEFFYDMG